MQNLIQYVAYKTTAGIREAYEFVGTCCNRFYLYCIYLFVQERLSNLNAGLRTWEDHLVRIQGLREELRGEIADMQREIREVGMDIQEEEGEEEGSTLQEKLVKCQVRKLEGSVARIVKKSILDCQTGLPGKAHTHWARQGCQVMPKKESIFFAIKNVTFEVFITSKF